MPIAQAIRNSLSHPLTRGLDIDDPSTTELRRGIIRSKPMLRSVYDGWYARLASDIPSVDRTPGPVLEIGSGAGYFKEVVPDTITSDVSPLDGVDQVIDASGLPFDDAGLRAIVMTNVLHHIPDCEAFFREASRSQ